jgi:hypothetical protein
VRVGQRQVPGDGLAGVAALEDELLGRHGHLRQVRHLSGRLFQRRPPSEGVVKIIAEPFFDSAI